MNAQVKTLVPSILSHLRDRGAAVSKTKLLKLLYLFDVEFYRVHRTLFTGFDWKFYHLGPWTAEIDDLLSDLVLDGSVVEIPFAAREFEGVTLRTTENVPMRKSISTTSDESILIRILNDWGEQPTGRLLDYVYFHTEPMEFGRRNERLDFSVISEKPVEKYKRSSSNLKASDLARKRREFQARFTARNSGVGSPATSPITPPRYDDEFAEALSTLERLGSS